MRLFPSLVIGLLLLAAIPVPVGAQGASAEVSFWESVRDSKTPAELEAYLKAYPDGVFSGLARIRLNRLKKSAPTSRVTPAPGKTPPVLSTAKGQKTKLAGDQGWIGVEIKNVTPEIADQRGLGRAQGALVVNLTSYGPAAAAGIRRQDIITEIDGKEISGMADLTKIVAKIWPGRYISFVVWRNRVRHSLSVKIGGWFTDASAAAAAGDADGMHYLGMAYQTGRGVDIDIVKAAELYRKAADKGHAVSQFRLGNLYARGQGLARNDVAAANWLTKAARQGHPQAQVTLGDKYQRGLGVSKDYAQALSWYQAAAQQGRAAGITGIANMHANGLGMPKNARKAAELYLKAAAKGHLGAQNNLANQYWTGNGIAQDKQVAIRLWRSAALRGNKFALSNLNKYGIAAYDAAAIQRHLSLLNYDPGPADGKPGRKTRSAIEQFQRNFKLAVDGRPSIKLLAALMREVSEKNKKTSKTFQTPSSAVTPPPPVGNESFDSLDSKQSPKDNFDTLD